MRDKRPVDELSIEELERILAIKKREARQSQMDRMKRSGRVLPTNGKPEKAPAKAKPVSAPAATLLEPIVEQAVDKPKRSIPPVTELPQFEDEPPEVMPQQAEERREQDRAWKRFVNASLFLVEVAAVFGLIFIAANMFGAIGELEAETQAAQQMSNATRQASVPTLEPTPTLRLDQIVLPGGHLIDTRTGEASPNFAEIPDTIPAHLLPTVQNQLLKPAIARPQPQPETARVVSIPRLNIEQTIIQGTDWEALQAGVGQAINGYTPASRDGNVVLAAHNDIYGELFRDLDKLQIGDEFYIQTETGIYTYIVRETQIVDPTDVWVMEGQGSAMATLISCYPHGVNNKRYVVFADRVNNA